MVPLRSFYPHFAIIFLLFHLLDFLSIKAQNDGFHVKMIRKTSHLSRSQLIGSSNNIQNIVQSPIHAYGIMNTS